MFTINGSLMTVGPDNELPIDCTYDYEKYCNRLIIQSPTDINDINEIPKIEDLSPFKNKILNNNVLYSLDQYRNTKHSYFFDGEYSYLKINSDNILLNGIFTISFWMFTQIGTLSNNYPRTLFHVGEINTPITGLSLKLSANNTTFSPNLSLFICDNKRDYCAITGTIDVVDGKWHNITVTRNKSNKINLFIDGKQQTSNLTFDKNLTISTDSCLLIGTYDYNKGFYKGFIDDFYILSGICEYESDFNPSSLNHTVPPDSEFDYSGNVVHVKINESVSKFDLLAYNIASRSFVLADATNLNKMPARAIALEEGKQFDVIKALTYGTVISHKSKFKMDQNEIVNMSEYSKNSNDTEIVSIKSTVADSSIKYSGSSSALPTDMKLVNLFKTSDTRNNKSSFTWNPQNRYCVKDLYSWFKIRLNEPKLVKSYSIRGSGITHESPVNFKIKGSKDNINWILLDSPIELTWNAYELKKFRIDDNTEEYQYFEIFDISGSGLREFQLYDEQDVAIIPNFDRQFLTISSDGDADNCECWKVSDGELTTYWTPSENKLSGELIFDFGFKYDSRIFDYVTVDGLSITVNNTDTNNQFFVPRVFRLDGSNNNISWETLYYFDEPSENCPWTTYGDRVEFNLTSQTHYRYYKLIFEQCQIIGTGDLPQPFKICAIELLNNGKNIIPINTGFVRHIPKNIKNIITITDNSPVYNLNNNPGYLFNKLLTKSSAYPNISNCSMWKILKTDKTPPYELIIDFGPNNEKICSAFEFEQVFNDNQNRIYGYPNQSLLQASNDSKTWTNISVSTSSSYNTSYIIRTIKKIKTTDSTNAYRYFKWNITSLAYISSTDGLYVQNFQLYDENDLPLIPLGENKYIYETDEYFTDFKQAEFSIDAPRNSQLTTNDYNHPSSLMNGKFSFNSTLSYSHEWCTESGADKLSPEIILNLPDSDFTLLNTQFDGYVIRTAIDNITPDSYRFPKSWIVSGWDGNSWIEIDNIIDYEFTEPNQRKQFTLSKSYSNLTKIKLEIKDTLFSSAILPPSFLSIKEFYITYKNNKLEIPFLFNNYQNCISKKYLNNLKIAATIDPTQFWEFEYSCDSHDDRIPSVSETPYIIGEQDCGRFLNLFKKYSSGWRVSDNIHKLGSLNAIDQDRTQLYEFKDSIIIKFKNIKLVSGYGILQDPIALCGKNKHLISWKLYGSNDNVNWMLLDSVSPLIEEKILESYPVVFDLKNNIKSYQYYKFESNDLGSISGIEFYESNSSIFKTNELAVSSNTKGGLSTIDDIQTYADSPSQYIQNVGYTGLSFSSAEEEYSVKFFDFNSQLTPVNSNVGEYTVTDINSGLIGHKIEDGPLVTLLCDSLYVHSKQILTVNQRCRGLRIIVRGDCVIDGTISMTNKGSFYNPSWIEDFPIITDRGTKLGTIPRYGALGGKSVINSSTDRLPDYYFSSSKIAAYRCYGKNGNPGIEGKLRQTGGGGSGAVCSGSMYTPLRSGSGGQGTCFGGGCGGGTHFETTLNSNQFNCYSAMPALNNSSSAGSGYGTSSGVYNQTGNITSSSEPAVSGSGRILSYSTLNQQLNKSAGSSGCGGLIILIVYGNLWVNIGGKIESNGSSYISPVNSWVSGGGSGGGSINIFHGGLFVNNGEILANGGVNTQLVKGGAGGDGCITIDKLK